MICERCREDRHNECPGGSWCDCQHQTASSDDGEPPENWVRQG